MNSVIDAFVTQYKAIGQTKWGYLPSYMATYNLKNAISAYDSSKTSQIGRPYLSLIAESLDLVKAAYFPASRSFFAYYNSLPGSGEKISFLENSYVKAFNLLLDASISETFAMIGFSYINVVPEEMINDLLLSMQKLRNAGLWNTNSLRVLLSANGASEMHAQLWADKTSLLLKLHANNCISPDSDAHVHFINDYCVQYQDDSSFLPKQSFSEKARYDHIVHPFV